MNIFNQIVRFLPLIIQIVQHVEETVHAPGVDKKAKAMELANTALAAVNAVDPDVLQHPAFQDAMGTINDAVVLAGNIGQAIVKAKN